MSVGGLGVCGTCDGAVSGATSGLCDATIEEVLQTLGVILVGRMCTRFLR